MKKVLSVIILLCFSAVYAEEVPIEDFAKFSQFKQFKISPDGKHIAFTVEDENQVKLAIMEVGADKAKSAIGAGGDKRGIYNFEWANNERIIVFSRKITGLHDGRPQKPLMGAVDIDGSKRHLLWDYQRSNIRVVSYLKDDPDHILVNKTHYADEDGAKLHRMNIYTAKLKYISDTPKFIGKNNPYMNFVGVDLNNTPRIALETERNNLDDFDDDISRMHFKNKEGEWDYLEPKLHKDRTKVPTMSPRGFNADNSIFYFASNHDLPDGDVLGLFQLDFDTKKIKFLFRHPDVNVGGGITGVNGELIGAYYEAGYPDYFYLSDQEVASEVSFHKSLRAAFKNQTVNISAYTDDGRTASLSVSSDSNPGDFYLFDRSTNKVEYTASSMPQIKSKAMSSVEPFTMVARDGLKMYGQLTIPKGKELKKLPMVIFPHGGPYGAKDNWGFDWRAQLLANRGYLVLQLNFRGSGGYGDNFAAAGNSEWGAKMQDDITDATLWAINQGYADKEKVCIHGISYGGYAAMQAVVKEPDLYKCSIPEAGPYEIDLQWKLADSFKGRREAGEIYKRKSFGSAPGVIKERSPVYHTDKIKAALLIVHGSLDKRVPVENAYLLEKKLKETGKSYETFYRKDGHGFRNVQYRVESFEKILAFLEKHIGK